MHQYHKVLPGRACALASLFAVTILCAGAMASEYGYSPNADPAATYQQALEQATKEQKMVLLVFGSEWCPDCRSLNTKMGQAPLSETVRDNFIVAHIDIGNWDKNMAFTEQFGQPVANGIPSIAIVAADKSLLYVSKAGEFASARSTGIDSLDEWFRARLALIEQQ